ncbi:MAG: LysR family transcriptional regulator [Myxococcota bacterium]|jgi:LysR family transcriptional activator of nhaA|nr:LysR family transcriptional regulator [Myxococcota bacterium]
MVDTSRIEWLNYHHLLYFYLVVREGGIVPAAKALRLSHSTVSGQLRVLEDALGVALFDRSGRRLVPTEDGHVVYRYATEIFGLGREMVQVLRGHAIERPALRIGTSSALPKLVCVELLEPALALGLRLSVEEDRFDRLVARLVTHELDVILTDAPLAAGSGARAFNHPLGESEVGVFAVPKLARALRRGFPGSLHRAPMVLPTTDATLRRLVDPWLERNALEPVIVAESSDSALAKAFAAAGHGSLVAPLVISEHLAARYGLRLVGKARGLRERFYAVSAERRVKAPGVAAICAGARTRLFAP